MAGPDKIQQKRLLQAWQCACLSACPANYYTVVAYYWLLLFLPACISIVLYKQSSSADGIAVVAVCCQSMSSVQYAIMQDICIFGASLLQQHGV